MKLHPRAVFLIISVGLLIQLLGLSGVVSAKETERGVPGDSGVPADSTIPAADPAVQASSVDQPGCELAPNNTAPENGDPSVNSGQSANSSDRSSSPSGSGFTQPESVIMPGSLYSTPLMGTVERKSFDAPSPNMTPPPLISPVVPYLNQTFQQQPSQPLLQGAQRPTAEPERDSKGSFFGKLSKSLLMGGANKNVPAAERPWWIPGHAFTDDSMVAPYHNLDIAWWDKRPMPNRPQWVRLATSVSRYWRGTVTEPCMVLVAPMEQVPGNFTFRSRSFGGPRGWLQALNVPDKKGFPQYRYWLDQP